MLKQFIEQLHRHQKIIKMSDDQKIKYDKEIKEFYNNLNKLKNNIGWKESNISRIVKIELPIEHIINIDDFLKVFELLDLKCEHITYYVRSKKALFVCMPSDVEIE